MDIFIWFLLLALWLFVALRDARRREILGWDVIESELWGERNVRPRYRGVIATVEQARRDRDWWTLEQREDNFTSSRTAGRIYALITGFLRSPFILTGLVIKLCWQPFRPLVAIVFARPTAKK